MVLSICISLIILDFEVVKVQNICSLNFFFRPDILTMENWGFDLIVRTAIPNKRTPDPPAFDWAFDWAHAEVSRRSLANTG